LRILLTGGLGYLGGRLAQTLAGAPDHELILGTRRRVAAAPPWLPQATIAAMDWSDERELARVCRGMDAIVHLAGMNAEACAKDPLGALAFNGVATARLLRAAIEQGVSRHRAGEDAVLMAHAAGTVQGIVVRLSNSFGAPVEPEVDCWSLLVNDLCRQAVATRQMVLRTAGQQRRDFVAISDACRAIVHLLKAPAAIVAEGLFNVGSGWAPTLLEMAEKAASRVESVLGFRPQIRTGVARDAVGDGKLDFGIRRILDTGFEWPQQSIVEELDRLIVFCARHAANTGRAV
jgi:UDP-glucose 4-epimerase